MISSRKTKRTTAKEEKTEEEKTEEKPCTKILLEEFSRAHYTYINQIFGDDTIKEIIQETYPSDKYYLFTQKADPRFFDSDSAHHVVREGNIKKSKIQDKTICSSQLGYQCKKNDTLCQSYSLLTYYNLVKGIITNNKCDETYKEIREYFSDEKEKQMKMIAMYREILKNQVFLDKFDGIFIEENNNLWSDYTESMEEKPKPMELVTNKLIIIKKINETLNNWESYGYRYFINGRCNDEIKRKEVDETNIIEENKRRRTTVNRHSGGNKYTLLSKKKKRKTIKKYKKRF